MLKTTSVLALGLTAAAVAVGCGGAATPGTGGPASSGKAVLPVPENPITGTANATGLTITKALVENNVDPATGKGTADHLEVTLKNNGARRLGGVEVYYRISDPKTKASEGYYAKLARVTIPSGASTVVHFDNTGKPGHVPVNKYSLYYTDKHALVVDVTAAAAGVKPATFTVKKDDGGAEAGVE